MLASTIGHGTVAGKPWLSSKMGLFNSCFAIASMSASPSRGAITAMAVEEEAEEEETGCEEEEEAGCEGSSSAEPRGTQIPSSEEESVSEPF